MILRVRLQNWKNFEDEEFEFRGGLNLIFGPNASGKTSILQAVFYALSGVSPERHGLLDFRRAGSSEACVELSFVSGDGDEYLVRRYVSGKKRVSERAHLYVSKSGGPVEIASKPGEVSDRLREILGFGTQFFLRTVYMKEGDVYEFLQSPSSKVLSEIDEMLQMDRIIALMESVNSLSKEKKRELKSRRKDLEETKMPSVKKQDLVKRKGDLESQLDSLRAEIEELLSQQDTLREAVDTLERILGLELSIEGSKDKLHRLVEGLEGEEPPRERLEAAIRKTLEELEEQKVRRDGIYSRISVLKNGVEECKEKLEKLERAKDRCPLCNQPLTPEHVKKLSKEFSETLSKLRKELQESENEHGELEAKIKNLDDRLGALRGKKREMEMIFEELRRLNGEKSNLERRFSPKLPRSLDKLESALSEIKSQIEEKQAEEDALKKDMFLIDAMLEASSKSAAELEQEVRTLIHQEFAISAVSEALQRTVKRLREEKLVEVKQRAARLLANFKPGIWSVNWDEKFVPQLSSPDFSLSAYQLSGAEKLQLFLVIRLAMASIIGEPDFILLDEPAYHMDSDRKKVVYGILKEYLESTGVSQLIVSSFEPELGRQDWDNKITLK